MPDRPSDDSRNATPALDCRPIARIHGPFALDREAFEILATLRHQYRRRDADRRPATAAPRVYGLSQTVREIFMQWKDRDCPRRREGRRFNVESLTVNLDAPTLQILHTHAQTGFGGNRSAALHTLIYRTVHPAFVCATGGPRYCVPRPATVGSRPSPVRRPQTP